MKIDETILEVITNETIKAIITHTKEFQKEYRVSYPEYKKAIWEYIIFLMSFATRTIFEFEVDDKKMDQIHGKLYEHLTKEQIIDNDSVFQFEEECRKRYIHFNNLINLDKKTQDMTTELYSLLVFHEAEDIENLVMEVNNNLKIDTLSLGTSLFADSSGITMLIQNLSQLQK